MVTATTFRKVQRDLGAGSESEKVKLRLSVEVETVDFDPDGVRLYCCPSSGEASTDAVKSCRRVAGQPDCEQPRDKLRKFWMLSEAT